MTIVGSHLDSVPEGPGINDNGSGSAFNLELALQMAKQNIKPDNRVRFAWWGAEESGLVGATRYVAAISDEEFDKIAANLNFDMLASPNHAQLRLRRRLLGHAAAGHRAGRQPGRGVDRADVRRLLRLASGVATEPTAFDGRSDYKPFQDNGVAAGGLFSGRGGRQDRGAGREVGRHGRTWRSTRATTRRATTSTTSIAIGYEQMADAARDRRRRVRHGPRCPRRFASRTDPTRRGDAPQVNAARRHRERRYAGARRDRQRRTTRGAAARPPLLAEYRGKKLVR